MFEEQRVNNRNRKANTRAKSKKVDKSCLIKCTQTKLPWSNQRLRADSVLVAQGRKAEHIASDQHGRGPASIPRRADEASGLQQSSITGNWNAISGQTGK